MFVCILLSCRMQVYAQEELPKTPWLEFHGYIKDLQSTYFIDGTDSLTMANLVHNRLNLKFNIAQGFTGRLEMRNRIFWGDQLRQTPDFGERTDTYNGLMDLSVLWVDKPAFVVHTVIDRMLLQYADERWDIRLGRQRINWGVNTVWNPNDIFNAYNFLDFDYEERPGTDAVRAQRFFTNSSSLEMAIAPGKTSKASIGALMYKFNRWKYDFQALGGVFNTDIVVGGGWAGNLKDAGFKGEVSYFHPYENATDTNGVVVYSLMTDRLFNESWYVSIAYLYNSNPTNSFAENGGIYAANLTAKSLYPFKHNVYLGVMKTISPIAYANLSMTYSPTYNAWVVFPTFTWNTAQNVDLDFTFQSFFADLSGVYESQGTAFFIRGRWSF